MAMEQRTRYRRVRFANEGEEEEGEGWRVVGSVRLVFAADAVRARQ